MNATFFACLPSTGHLLRGLSLGHRVCQQTLFKKSEKSKMSSENDEQLLKA